MDGKYFHTLLSLRTAKIMDFDVRDTFVKYPSSQPTLSVAIRSCQTEPKTRQGCLHQCGR
eukprot:scaffold19227_cov84-Amphora_coffeaeformis.AAC.1